MVKKAEPLTRLGLSRHDPTEFISVVKKAEPLREDIRRTPLIHPQSRRSHGFTRGRPPGPAFLGIGDGRLADRDSGEKALAKNRGPCYDGRQGTNPDTIANHPIRNQENRYRVPGFPQESLARACLC